MPFSEPIDQKKASLATLAFFVFLSLFLGLLAIPATSTLARANGIDLVLDRSSGSTKGMTRVKFSGQVMTGVNKINFNGSSISFTQVSPTNYAVLLPNVSIIGGLSPWPAIQPDFTIQLEYQTGSPVSFVLKDYYSFTDTPRIEDQLTSSLLEVIPGQNPSIGSTLPAGNQMARWVGDSPLPGLAITAGGTSVGSWESIMNCTDTQDKTLLVRTYDSNFNAGFVQPKYLENNQAYGAEPFAGEIQITYKASPNSEYCNPSRPDPRPRRPSVEPAEKIISKSFPGFAPRSDDLRKIQKNKILRFLGKNPGFKAVTVVGQTSTRFTTTKSTRLALSRANSAWKFILKNYPEATLREQGSITDKGKQLRFRAVTIKLIF